MEKGLNLNKILLVIGKEERGLKALDWAVYLGNNCKNQSELVVYYDLRDVYYLKELAFAFGVQVEIDVDKKEKKRAEAKLKEILNKFSGNYKIEFFYSGRRREKVKDIVDEVSPDLIITTLDYINVIPKYERDTLVVS